VFQHPLFPGCHATKDSIGNVCPVSHKSTGIWQTPRRNQCPCAASLLRVLEAHQSLLSVAPGGIGWACRRSTWISSRRGRPKMPPVFAGGVGAWRSESDMAQEGPGRRGRGGRTRFSGPPSRLSRTQVVPGRDLLLASTFWEGLSGPWPYDAPTLHHEH
jgi:hypothetical protein